MARLCIAVICTLFLAFPVSAESFATSLDPAKLAQHKRTAPGLYLTSAEAAAILKARSDILLIDVRTPEETVLIGYPAFADANIPLTTFDPAHPVNARSSSYVTVPNEGFVAAFRSFVDARSPDAVFVICRSGARSAAAVNLLDKAGMEVPLYNVVDGFEGAWGENGKRDVDGWKNSGAPWTMQVRDGFLIKTQ